MFEESRQEMKELSTGCPPPLGSTPVPGGSPASTNETTSALTSNGLPTSLPPGRHCALKDTESAVRRAEEGTVPGQKRPLSPQDWDEDEDQDREDGGYWEKRRRNNEAARRSREKRRLRDVALESRVEALLEENSQLRAQLLMLRFRFGLVREPAGTAVHSALGPTPSAARFCSPRSEGGCPHPHPTQGSLRGARGGGDRPSEDLGLSARGGSCLGSPVFFDDHLGEPGKPWLEPHPLPVQEKSLCGAVGQDMFRGDTGEQLDSFRGVKSLPHKLRFKTAVGGDNTVGWDSGRSHRSTAGARDTPGEPGGGAAVERQLSPQPGQVSLLPDSQYQAENHLLHSQLSSLSREIAQLKRLFSQQLLSKSA